MANNDDIYRVLMELKAGQAGHTERFNSIESKIDPLIEKVSIHDRALIAVSAAGAMVVMIGGLFVTGIKAAIAAIVTHG